MTARFPAAGASRRQRDQAATAGTGYGQTVPSPNFFSRRARRASRLSLAAVALALLTGCQDPRLADLRRLAPSLDLEFASHLLRDDDTAFGAFVRRTGYARAAAAGNVLRFAAPLTTPAEFAAADSLLATSQIKLQRAIAVEFDCPGALTQILAYRRLDVGGRMESARLCREPLAIEADARLDIEGKAKRYERLIHDLAPFGAAVSLGGIYGRYAQLLPRLGRTPEMIRQLDLGIAASIRGGEPEMACQLLGTRGLLHHNEGTADSTWVSWNHAIDIAQKIGSAQEARILRFASVLEASQGHLALGRDLLVRAAERCHATGSVEQEIQVLLESGKFFASLGCLDLMGQNVRRADALLRLAPTKYLGGPDATVRDLVEQARALYASSTGDCETAARSNALILRRMRAWEPSAPRETAVLYVAMSLRRCGKHATALEVLRDGTASCRKYSLPELLSSFAAETAQNCWSLGDLDGCAGAIADFRAAGADYHSSTFVRDQVAMDALAVRIVRARGGAAVDSLEAGLRRYRSELRGLGAGPESYLVLGAGNELRCVAHELFADRPDVDYAFEMRWRAMQAQDVGADLRHPATPSRTTDAGSDAGALGARLAAYDVMHCAYAVLDDAVVRWSMDRHGVRREVLVPKPDELRRAIDATIAALATSSDRSDLEARLHTLAAWLLPPVVASDAAPSLLLVSPDAFLNRVPFAALNVAASGYEPLVRRSDVAELRFWGRETAPPPPSRAVIVTAPDVAPALRRRYSVLTEDLRYGASETSAIERLFRESMLLHGASATKAALTSHWQNAGCIYFATHVIQDPEVPYIVFVPLARGATEEPDASYLNPADVRAADLSRCALIVLSGCTSAGPLVGTGGIAPGLADAFIDAGAASVVQTLWNVRDEDAARTMETFAAAYGPGLDDPVHALAAADRALVAAGAGPAVWGAYSVVVTGLYGRVDPVRADRTP